MNKIAIITGSSYGIGHALAINLLEKNYLVFGYARTNSIKHQNFKFTQIDLSNIKTVRKIKFPSIKGSSQIVLINNAATIGKIVPLNKKSDEDIIYEYNLNLIAPVLILKNFIHKYNKQKKLILNISSGAAKQAIASWSTYCSSKSAIDSITNVINIENHNNLEMFCVRPGIVDTKMQKNIRDANPNEFPMYQRFIDYYQKNELFSANSVATRIMKIVEDPERFSSKSIDIRDL